MAYILKENHIEFQVWEDVQRDFPSLLTLERLDLTSKHSHPQVFA